ncbi:G0/G1 switch protein 2 [Acipenser ruthenus]|uniref:G0/G1 switch protein 2 n=1 Tax=Acipenser ruthenus TaxID=7906 RepID=A0A444V289_ACIRT|nr:G0/G1 switch protein 2 [Acipenser ruthenus]RXM94576.1 G0/G1 switch protein 2 [Acipenser ruthenus]
METMQELIPFAKEMLSQKPNRKMVKVYLVGTVLAFFGVVIGLVETVCHPFSSEEPLEEDGAHLTEQERRAAEETEKRRHHEIILEKEKAFSRKQLATTGQRSTANRLHAS